MPEYDPDHPVRWGARGKPVPVRFGRFLYPSHVYHIVHMAQTVDVLLSDFEVQSEGIVGS
jgi:hypothetical protein